MEQNFDDAWNNATASIIRLETLPIYEIPAEMVRFEKFKRGLPYLDDELNAWKNRLKETAQCGIKIERYRVVDEPISDYLKYEFDYWKKTMDSQHVFTIKRKDYLPIVKNDNGFSTDFWMFDQKIVYRMNYSPKGLFLNGTFESDGKTIQRYQKIMKEIAAKSTPLDKLLQ